MTDKVRALGQNLLLTVTVIIFALLLLEVAARVASNFLGVAPYITYNPQLGWSPKANSTKIHKKPGSFSATYNINSLGYRGKLHAIKPEPDKFRIVLLGDSVGFGWGVDDDQTYGAKLETLMPGIEVINLAVSGYGTDQQLLRLKSEGIGFQPDLVILHVVDNDFLEIRRPFMYQRAKPYFLLDEENKPNLNNVPVKSSSTLAKYYYDSSLPLPFNEWLAWNSYAYTFINKRYRELMFRAKLTTGITAKTIKQGEVTPPEQSWQLFKSLVDEIAIELKKHNMKGVIIHASAQLNNSTKIAELPLPTLNFYPLLYELHTKKEVSLINDSHFNPFGHKLLAQKLADELVTMGLIRNK
ncbi:MAG: hypothetical protein HQL69_03960 [Magnetococcales bacterium]|nr:hypothetical protein [Magnetococcales bacterium]